ncbi:Zinc knuckle (CCHC-type) family protein [Thalictrum thalictroides]|uniref:Zinc knuckle (CCHC-type) family protein n=1 Tax=Thalictrum thalictroides TaxID=46969 RepID=A0A7J6US64_THATH|nr:Zinc knuckle (CCHC-type) family protein [Thalictrum thalictroides]
MSNTQNNPDLITASVRQGEEEEFNAIEAIVSKFGPDSLEKYRRRKVEATYGNQYVEKNDVESNIELEVTSVNDVPTRLKWSDEDQIQKLDEKNLGFGGNKKLGFGGGNKDDIAEKGSGTTNVEGGKSWADVLGRATVGNNSLEYIPPMIVEGKLVIHVQSEQFIHLKEKNSKLVVGSFIGRRPGYAYVKDVVTRMWRLKNPFIMRANGDRMFTFEFEKEENRSIVLEMGSFHVASQQVVIRPWKLFVETESEELTTIPIWVFFKQFPIDLWDSKGFSMVGSAVGKPLFTDRLTKEKRRTSYARICIEVDTKCKFPRETTVVLDKQKVIKIPIEYNWKPAKCSTCDVFGHHDKTCPKKKQKKVEQSVWVEKEKLEDDSGSVVGDDLQLVVVNEDHVVEKSNEGNTTNYESIQKRVGEKLAKLKGSNNEGGDGHPQSVQKRSGMTSGSGYGTVHKVTEVLKWSQAGPL